MYAIKFSLARAFTVSKKAAASLDGSVYLRFEIGRKSDSGWGPHQCCVCSRHSCRREMKVLHYPQLRNGHTTRI